MENLTVSAVLKPLLIASWFFILAASPFVFPEHGIPYWLVGLFVFFGLLLLLQMKKFELSGNQIRMKNYFTGKTTVLERGEIERIAIGEMPATIGVRLGLMRRGRMATVLSKNNTKINIATTSTGHQKFDCVEEYLHFNYPEFLKKTNQS